MKKRNLCMFAVLMSLGFANLSWGANFNDASIFELEQQCERISEQLSICASCEKHELRDALRNAERHRDEAISSIRQEAANKYLEYGGKLDPQIANMLGQFILKYNLPKDVAQRLARQFEGKTDILSCARILIAFEDRQK